MEEESFLDGNAIAGLLQDVFGRDMTAETGCCDGCGATTVLAAVRVYRSGPGDVVRCPNCESVLMVIVQRRLGIRVGYGSLRWLEVS